MYGCISINKEVIIPCRYKKLYKFDSQGYAVAQKGGKVGMIDTLNHTVIPFEYKSFYSTFDDKGIAIVSQKIKGISKYMFIDRNNKTLGTFLEQTFKLHEKEFHIYANNGMYGFAKQFGRSYSGAIYKDIRVIDELTIEVSVDGHNYQTIRYL